MSIVIALIFTLGSLWIQPGPKCQYAAQIVANGIANFEAGVPQIGPYTDVESYAVGGAAYIALVCRREQWEAT